jgi:sugar lactone lactonase YvrE
MISPLPALEHKAVLAGALLDHELACRRESSYVGHARWISTTAGSLGNGMAGRVWADVTGDGICIDAEGAIWCSAVGADGGNVVWRVREGGEILDRIEVDRPCYACMLGGEDGRTLFMVVAQWFGPDRIDELIEAKTGQILTARVAVPHAGWP